MTLGVNQDIPRPSLRARVYWLTAIISHFQPSGVHDETLLNPNNNKAQEGLSTTTLFHAHLATLLTRGKGSEVNRIVAVTSGTLLSGDETIQVFSAPYNSPDVTPNISPSSSSQDNAASPEKPASEKPAGKPTIVLSRNSRVLGGSAGVEAIILPESSQTLTLLRGLAIDPGISKNDFTRISIPDDFSEFAKQLLEVFGVASAIRQESSPAEKREISMALSLYAVVAGGKKIRSRLVGFQRLYNKPHNWTPREQEIRAMPAQTIPVRDYYLQALLDQNHICKLGNDKFEFNGLNMVSWWRTILSLISSFSTVAYHLEHNFVAGHSNALRILLASVPARFWTQESLQHHLVTCRARAKAVAAEKAVAKAAAATNDDESANADKNNASAAGAGRARGAVPPHDGIDSGKKRSEDERHVSVNVDAQSLNVKAYEESAGGDNDTSTGGDNQTSAGGRRPDSIPETEDEDDDELTKMIEEESLDP
ncbi:hypothetical protein B0H16DRAFT_1550315, partial [Mycena metata]